MIDAYGEHPERDVLIVPTSIIYDQQHEVGAISAEEMGGKKKPESIKWMYEFASSQSRRLGRAYLRFGEPLSLADAVALTADEEGALRPRLAVQKVAFENANRINAATPITPGALITFALLDNGDRSITVEEGRRILQPLADYIQRRQLPMTEWPDLSEFGRMREVLDRLVSEGVVTVYRGGTEPVYAISPGKQHEAAFYRNTIIHFFLNRAIAELAALQAAEDDAADIPEATWQNARRLKELLRFEFFFPRHPGVRRADRGRDHVHEPELAGPHLQPGAGPRRRWPSWTCSWPTGSSGRSSRPTASWPTSWPSSGSEPADDKELVQGDPGSGPAALAAAAADDPGVGLRGLLPQRRAAGRQARTARPRRSRTSRSAAARSPTSCTRSRAAWTRCAGSPRHRGSPC